MRLLLTPWHNHEFIKNISIETCKGGHLLSYKTKLPGWEITDVGSSSIMSHDAASFLPAAQWLTMSPERQPAGFVTQRHNLWDWNRKAERAGGSLVTRQRHNCKFACSSVIFLTSAALKQCGLSYFLFKPRRYTTMCDRKWNKTK